VKEAQPLAVPDSDRVIPRAPPLPTLPPEKTVQRTNVKMKQIFWNKIKPENVMHTFWDNVIEGGEVQWKSLEEKFGEVPVQRRRAIIRQTEENNDSVENTKQKVVNLFDSRRTQNVAIACAKLRKTPVEIYDIVCDMDPADLTLDVTEVILNLLLPTADEIACLRAYTGSVEQLDYCGQLFSFFTQIEELESRLIIQKIMLSWTDEANYALSVLEELDKSLNELKNANTLDPLQHIMAIVLSVGNYMNGANRTGRAHGFKLDTLLKLKDIREKKYPQRNLLHFVIEQFPSPDASVFYSHWEGMWNVAKISKGSAESIIKQLKESLEVCMSAIDSASKICDDDIRENLIQRLSIFINKSSVIYDEVCEFFESLDDTIIKLKRHFGEILMANNFEIDDDPWSSFFSTMVSFATMHKTAIRELVDMAKRLQQQKAREASQEERKRKQLAAAASLKNKGANGGSQVDDNADDEATSSMYLTPPRMRTLSDELCLSTNVSSRRSIGSQSTRSPSTPINRKNIQKVNICEVFKERMLALNGSEEPSDSDEEW